MKQLMLNIRTRLSTRLNFSLLLLMMASSHSIGMKSAILAILGVAITGYGLIKLRKEYKRRRLGALRRSFSDLDEFAAHDVLLTESNHDDTQNEISLEKEQLTRNFSFFGEDGQKEIMNSFVIIIGCGGVGSFKT